MSVKHLLVGAATAALLAQPVLAQDKQPQAQAGQAQSGQAQLADVDLDFAKEAAQGGLMEVRLGELAEQQGKSQAVQNFGKRMVADHSKANDKLMQLAEQKGVELPQSLSEDAQETYGDLQQQTGADFDEAYMDQMVSDHEDTVDAFEDYVNQSKDSELRGFAVQTLPTLKEHLRLAEQTQEQVEQAGEPGQPAAGMASNKPAGDQKQGWVSVNEVLGSEVVNADGDEVGEIKDLVMKDDAYYAVLAVGGFLGIGQKDVALPLDQLKLGEDQSYLMSKQTEDQLKEMPAYQKAAYQPAPRS